MGSVLREELRSQQIAGGASLRASAAAERLGVPVTPVREALRRLETERLITYEAHHGATVVDLGPDALRELYALRAVVEGLGARLAAERITPEEVEQLRALHARMISRADAGDGDELGRLSEELHLRITDVGGPTFLGAQARAVRGSCPVPRSASLWSDPAVALEHLGEHGRLLDALERADGPQAERIMRSHVERSGRYRSGRRPQGAPRR